MCRYTPAPHLKLIEKVSVPESDMITHAIISLSPCDLNAPFPKMEMVMESWRVPKRGNTSGVILRDTLREVVQISQEVVHYVLPQTEWKASRSLNVDMARMEWDETVRTHSKLARPFLVAKDARMSVHHNGTTPSSHRDTEYEVCIGYSAIFMRQEHLTYIRDEKHDTVGII
jgi:hypothetical protein